MCFSPQISFTLFTAGAILTYLTYKDPNIRSSYMYVLFGFYTLMELLQTIQYSVVNQCDSPLNILTTEFAYLLVIVQPLMWNTIFFIRGKNDKNKSIFKLAIVFCVIWIAMNVYSRLTYNEKTANDTCGFFNNSKTCTYRDTAASHLYWKWKTNHLPDMTANYFMYLCLWFVPPLLVPETRLSGLVLTIGAIVGYTTTRMYGNNIFEFPAIWCYISVPILALGYFNTIFQKQGVL